MRKVFIWGGCATRDAVEHYPNYGLQLQHYVARQSLISAFNPASPKEFDIPTTLGRFQHRMIIGDITSNLKTHLRDNTPDIDLLIWDLNIERVGATKVRSGGIITRHGIPRKPGLPPLGGTYQFGTPDYLRVWEGNLDRLVRLLKHHDLLEKTVINATPWATTDKHGQPATSSSEMTPDRFNPVAQQLWELAEQRGIKVARIPQHLAIADPDHKWGPAYFHYIPETYKAQLETITAIM